MFAKKIASLTSLTLATAIMGFTSLAQAEDHNAQAAHHEAKMSMDPDAALKKLMNGNMAFVKGKLKHPDQSMSRVKEVSSGQSPFAVIVSCSDSRVPPEVVFDQGIGDLFVVRSAGEVVSDQAIGSVEYAIAHLGSSLIVVMGHKKCGAVKATVEGGPAPSVGIGAIVKDIQPAVDQAKQLDGDLLDNAIKLNVKLVAAKLSQSPILKKALDDGKLKIVGAYYDLDDGIVKAVQ